MMFRYGFVWASFLSIFNTIVFNILLRFEKFRFFLSLFFAGMGIWLIFAAIKVLSN